MNDVVRKTVEFVRPQNKFDDITFETQLDDAIPVAQLDPPQIQQVLLNLFMNAADAMNDAGVADKTITVISHLDATRQQVILTVTDNGPGMNWRDKRAHLRADLHDQEVRPRLRALDLIPHHREPLGPHRGDLETGRGGHVHREPPAEEGGLSPAGVV